MAVLPMGGAVAARQPKFSLHQSSIWLEKDSVSQPRIVGWKTTQFGWKTIHSVGKEPFVCTYPAPPNLLIICVHHGDSGYIKRTHIVSRVRCEDCII